MAGEGSVSIEVGGETRERRAIRRSGLHLEARDRIRDMILTGELAAGERIDERRLCDLFSLSRTPVREALKVLAAEGLVELLPNRGCKVTRLDAEAVGHLFEVMATLERLAAETTAARATDVELGELRETHDAMVAMYRAGRREDYFDFNHRIHQAVIRLTRNPILIETHADLLTRARRPRYLAITSEDRWTESVREHELLMHALALRDARSAGEVLFRHVLKTGEVVRASLDGGGSLHAGRAEAD